MWQATRGAALARRSAPVAARSLVPVVALTVVLLTTACSSEEPFEGSDIAPTATPSVTVTQVPVPPIGSRQVSGRGWTMSVPAQWEERRRTLGESGEVARWSEATPDAPAEVAVSVVVDTKPARSLLDQSYQLEQRLRQSEIIPVRSAVTRTDTETPGVLVQWEENSRGDEVRREVWQLFLPGAGGTIINVVGYAPVDSFDTSSVPKVMGTMEVTS